MPLLIILQKPLVHLINDLRAEFDAPDMLAVVDTAVFAGYRMNENHQRISSGPDDGEFARRQCGDDPEIRPQITRRRGCTQPGRLRRLARRDQGGTVRECL